MSHARKEARQPRRRLTGSSHCGVWGWCSKRPGDRGQCRGTTTEHRSSPREPHQPKVARNSGTRTLCSAPKRCNSNGAISMFEIHVGELRATFLRNHNMRCLKDPKQKTTQAQQTEDPQARKTTQADDTPSGRQLKHRRPPQPRQPPQPPQARGHCTRYGALHPLRGGAPEQKRCIAYGSGAAPQHTRVNAELAHRVTPGPQPDRAQAPSR